MSELTLPVYTFTLNGRETTVAADPKASVLDVLRERLGVLTMKAGCSPQGLCGCCTALVEGKPRLTCTLPVKSLAGKSVTTLEAVDPAVREAIAAAFTLEGGTQCGYCTPGIALSVSAMLAPGPAQNLSPTDDDIHRVLAPHLCRCTGYTGVIDSIKLAACALRDGTPLVCPPRPEAREQVLGERPFVDDLVRPDLVYAVLVWAPFASGVAELELPAGAPPDLFVLALEVRHSAAPVAVVWGSSLAEAKALARSVVVRRVGPVGVMPAEPARPVDLRAEPGAALSAPAGGAGPAPPSGPKAVHMLADVQMATTDPVYLEPEAVLVVPTDEGAGPMSFMLYTASQRPAAELASVRESLRVPTDVVRARVLPSGGSYGGKISVVPARAALEVARRTGRPVRLSLDLEEGMRLHPRRAGGRADATISGTHAGFSRVAVRIVEDAGAAAGQDLGWVGTATGEAGSPYAGDFRIESRAESSSNPPAGPVRGAGVCLGTLAIERAVDGYARATGKDPFAVRRAAAGTSAGLLLDALGPVWSGGEGQRGLGLACGGTGFGRVRVVARVSSASEVELYCNVPELGQGRDAALVRILARETGLADDVFTVPWGDPDLTLDDAWGPVEPAARLAALALGRLVGPLEGHVGVTVTGEADAVVQGSAAAVVRLGPEGEIVEVHVAVLCGADQDPLDVRRVAEGAAHMGVGVALSEEVALTAGDAGPMPETRFRMLGLLKSKVSPRIVGHVVLMRGAGAAGAGDSGCADCADAALSATAAAIANAVSAFEGSGRASLPMKDSAAARSVGVRLRPAPTPA
ncbi:MAG: 2Fe-2S iron-sulfur cluster binding domain-containing protein [Myxococcales bacterium]|nr:2Fe-2S iron-sulfur cluster binding domain-containing protein [Myxococcales bacterium]